MKALKIAILTALLPCRLFAGNTDSVAKAYFHTAKIQLENMLNGKETPSYEKAIFLIENAWWEGGIDYDYFRSMIDYHTQRIRELATYSIEDDKLYPKSDLTATKEQKLQRYKSSLANFAIYKYMTTQTLWAEDTTFFQQMPYEYSSQDPMGTIDWTNTHVTHLINKNNGNCFALASLFKIFSDRLNSDAILCTAPSHIYIRHADEKGIFYNVEMSNRAFPGTGTIETLTYTPTEATKNNIALRELDTKQSITLCVIYLAKGYEYKFGIKDDNYMLNCAEIALKYDERNLNAMLLKAEVLEDMLIQQQKPLSVLQQQEDFKEYQAWVKHIYQLGYREMPFGMKSLLIKGWTKDTIIQLASKDHTPNRTTNPNITPTRYASLSWGLFDEEIKTKPVERIGNTAFDTENQKIIAFLDSDVLYNNYNFDPVVFAWNVDPLAHEFPWQSPYAAFDNTPIWKNDPTGKSGEIVIDKQAKTATLSMNIYLYGSQASTALAKSTARDIQNLYNSANATVNIGGESYRVQFEVQGGYLGSGGNVMNEVNMAGKVLNNINIKNNFFRVENQASPNGGESFATLLGNDGMFNYSEISGIGSTTEGHEVGHGLGLKHNNASSWQSKILGEPDLMDTRNDIVSDKYRKEYGLSDGTLDIGKRKVSQKNIDNIFTPAVTKELQKNGKASVGTTSNTYYLPNAAPVKK